MWTDEARDMTPRTRPRVHGTGTNKLISNNECVPEGDIL